MADKALGGNADSGDWMTLDLARWLLVFTRINRFFLVPATIGQAFPIALLQAGWYRSRRGGAGVPGSRGCMRRAVSCGALCR